jgi:hypothetical protein
MDDQWSPSPAAGSTNYNKAALLRALVPLAAPRYLSITYVKRQLYTSTCPDFDLSIAS